MKPTVTIAGGLKIFVTRCHTAMPRIHPRTSIRNRTCSIHRRSLCFFGEDGKIVSRFCGLITTCFKLQRFHIAIRMKALCPFVSHEALQTARRYAERKKGRHGMHKLHEKEGETQRLQPVLHQSGGMRFSKQSKTAKSQHQCGRQHRHGTEP